MRKGEVISLDTSKGMGIIVDANMQEIHFIVDNGSDGLSAGSIVVFEIALSVDGLFAVEVREVHSSC